MAETTAPPVIHQALHGYDEGHRLLSCSRALPREVERAMLALSDAAGSGMPDGFESYLTAYPIRSAGIFVFARTWAAPELPRPGCVWTHSLLIDLNDVARFDSAAAFSNLFRRPSLPPEEYDQPIHVSLPIQPLSPAKDGLECAARVIQALYAGDVSNPVVVTAERSMDAESLFLALWDQQWAELRSTFTFSTGSLTPRVLDRVPFRLQATPQTTARRVWTRVAATVIESGILPRGDLPSEWAQAAADALRHPEAALTRFVRAIGRDLPAGYAYFRPLVEAYLACTQLTGSALVRSLIATAASTFPTSDSGVAFKAALLGGRASTGTYVRAADDLVVATLAESELSDAFPPGVLRVESRAEAWWAETRDYSLVAQVVDSPSNLLRSAFLNGVARAVSVFDIQRFAAAHHPADATVAMRRPDYASRPELWRAPANVQARLAEIVRASPDTFGDLASIVRAALSAHADAAAPALGETASDKIVPVMMDWVAETGDIEGIGPRWREILAERADEVIAWLSTRQGAGPWPVWLAADIISPDASELRRAGAGPWLAHMSFAGDLPAWARRRLDTFLLGLGLRDSEDDTFGAVSATFGRVYRAVEDGSLDERSWSCISHLLPKASWWREWDRCERLRLGIVDRFLSRQWSEARLFDLIGDDHVSSDLVAEFSESRDGRRFLRRVTRAVEDGTLSLPVNYRGPRRLRW